MELYIQVFVYLSVCLCVHRERERERERETDRLVERIEEKLTLLKIHTTTIVIITSIRLMIVYRKEVLTVNEWSEQIK